MATERLITIGSSGKNYTTLVAAEDGEDNTGDIVTSNEYVTFTCYDPADVAVLTINGWTTGVNNWIEFISHSTFRHAGVYDANKTKLAVASNYAYLNTITEEFVRFDGIQFVNSGTPSPGGINVNFTGTGEIRVSNCLIFNSVVVSGDRAGIILDDVLGASSVVKIWNNVIWDQRIGIGIDFTTNTGHILAIYNNTIIDCGTSGGYSGFRIVDSAADILLYMKNNLVNHSLGYINYNVTAFTTRNYKTNLSEDATAPTTSPDTGTINTAITFADEAGKNFGLVGTLPGTNLSADPDGFINITTDIKGVTRTEWSIGAFEYVAADGLSIPVAKHVRSLSPNFHVY